MPDAVDTSSQAFNGYERPQTAEPDYFLAQVGRGTPGGEYLRRFWQPVAYLDELRDVPLRVRALGEDLVAFRDGRDEVGVLHLHCCHRNTSLEFGLISDRGIRCCYHGRLFDTDGTILEIPGDPAADKLRVRAGQGAYPTHVWGGIVFAYMGPLASKPVFPLYDRFTLPDITIVPGVREPMDCNWLQIQENTMDPHHTAFLHVIPQLRGMDHFAPEFKHFPQLTWSDSPAGLIYLAVRRVGENIWVRSAETLGPNVRTISSVWEKGIVRKYASPPLNSFFVLPVDDTHTINFFISHISENEIMPFETRRRLEIFGQFDDRPYRDRQWIPGDHEAMTGQGPINVHKLEQLGSLDRGVAMFRRYVRRGIEAVTRGENPPGTYFAQDDVPPTFANDYVAPVTELAGDPEDPAVLVQFAERLVERYRQYPPMAALRSGSPVQPVA